MTLDTVLSKVKPVQDKRAVLLKDLFITEEPAPTVSTPPLTSQVDDTDLLYPLVQLLAAKKSCSLAAASHHPFINFVVTRRARITEEEQRSFVKFISHIENFLSLCEDESQLQAFLGYFASKQGLILFRCPILTLRYFGKMVEKLIPEKTRFLNIFKILSYPVLLTCDNRYDQIVQQVLSDEKITSLDEDGMNAFVQALLKGSD